MSTRPKVSVVMPCFNHASYVGAAVESVLGQTFTDLELIAIDDASRDETPAILRSFRDPRLHVSISPANRGAHATINAGIAAARGELVTVINSDDVFATTRIERLLETRARTGADVLGTDITLIGRDGSPITQPSHYWLRWFEGLKSHLATHGDLRRTVLTGNLFITTSNLFFTKQTYESVGPFADLRYTHDYEWIIRALDRGTRVRFDVDAKTLSYRLHGGNTILESPIAAHRETFEVLLRAMPTLAGEKERAVFADFAEHLARVEHDIDAVHHRTMKQRVVAALRQAKRTLDRRRG
jgi:glycosyltransferase involved in cell wall biosynthesis